jgi:hypothetical protein
MHKDLVAAIRRLNLPSSTDDYTRADWAKHNAAVDAWFETQNEPPSDGSIEVVDLTADSPTFGQATIVTRQARDRTPRRQSIGIRRRTCTGRRRPGGRTARSTASSGGAESDSDGPGERPRRLLLLGVRDRRLADSLARIAGVSR